MKTNKLVKILSLAISLTLSFALLAGCSNNGDTSRQIPDEGDTSAVEIKVGVCAGPYEDMFREAIEPSLKEKGYTLEYVQFSDYVQPNRALDAGEINVNIFQHSVYLKNFSEEHGLDLVHITEIPTAGMGIFSDGTASIDKVQDGAEVAIPNDVTNLARAIRVLEQAGLVRLDPDVDPAEATQYTLSENPKNLKFVEIEAPQLPRSLESVDLAVINGNFALDAGLNLSDALFNEKLQEGYVNVIAVRAEDENAEFAKDIVSTVHSDAFRSVIEDDSKQYVSFFRPKDYEQ
ncbi:MAG: MetQ/NlpA family ABC transporter substrate-binding protein [Oscillospiraceae bacterium]|nr:MetQ/NlpA family ABC transporter substrate-binding protein [Oscillospiraceae bacterium]